MSPVAIDPRFYARKYPEPAKPYPAPIVTSNDPIPDGVTKPRPVADLEALARRAGWNINTTYAEGWVPHASHGTPGAEPKQSWAVRLERHGSRAVAVRMADTWTSFWVWSRNRGRHRILGLDNFKADLRGSW